MPPKLRNGLQKKLALCTDTESYQIKLLYSLSVYYKIYTKLNDNFVKFSKTYHRTQKPDKLKTCIEYRSRVVSIPTSHLGDPGFKFLPRVWLT